MRWQSTEVKALSGTNGNAFTEQLDLLDRDGNVLKRYAKSANGSVAETTSSFIPAVARVATGTIDTALSGTPVVLRFGDLFITTVASGEGVPDDDDGTELIPYLTANAALIPADNVVDNEDQTFTITYHPGANQTPLISGDAALTFAEDVAGANASNGLVSVSGFDYGDVEAGSGNSAFITVTELAHPESALRITKVAVAARPTTIGNTTAISFGNEPLITFPAGKIHSLSANVEDFSWGLDNLGNATPIVGTMGGDISLGSTGTTDSTLNSTDVNVLASTSYDPFSTPISANSAINVILDGTVTPITVYLNAIIDDGDVSNGASDILEANGTFYFVWYQLPG